MTAAPVLLFIVGPPAVGKMTVGAEIARRTGLRLFHNHQTIDLVLPFFPSARRRTADWSVNSGAGY